MKKLITSALFAFTLFTVNAASLTGDITAKATSFARQMVNEVQLNESEYIQVRRFTIEKLERETEIRSMYSNDQEMMVAKLTEADNNYNHKLQEVLNPKQFESYVAFSSTHKMDMPVVAGNQE